MVGAYGVRSAVTSRASRIMVLEPATRRQEASKFGQAFCEQFGPRLWMSSRSPFARACGTLASTCGAKPGRTVSAAATNAAIAMAESALIMTVPCHWAFWPVVSLVNGYPAAVSGCLRQGPKWFLPAGDLFRRRRQPRNNAGSPRRRPDRASGSSPDRKEIRGLLPGGGEPTRLAGPLGAG